MEFKMVHNNINVLDLDKSMRFYEEALGLKEISRIQNENFIIAYLGNKESSHRLELTWLKERKTPYNLGDNEFHLAFETEDFEKAYALHKKMECVCFENKEMGIYFINDPDGYWLEIIPAKE